VEAGGTSNRESARVAGDAATGERSERRVRVKAELLVRLRVDSITSCSGNPSKRVRGARCVRDNKSREAYAVFKKMKNREGSSSRIRKPTRVRYAIHHARARMESREPDQAERSKRIFRCRDPAYFYRHVENCERRLRHCVNLWSTVTGFGQSANCMALLGFRLIWLSTSGNQ
jgi:hypothetical protein